MTCRGGLQMGKVYDHGREHWAKMQADSASRRGPPKTKAGLKGGGGGGTSGGGMEARLAKLEAQMEHVQSDLTKLAGVPVDIATIKGDMVTKTYLDRAFEKHLHWTLGIVGAMLTIATLIITFIHR